MTNEGGREENGEREREVQYGPALKNKKLDKDGRHGTSACRL